MANGKYADVEFKITSKYASRRDLFTAVEETYGLTGIVELTELSMIEYRFSEFKAVAKP